MRDWLKQKIKNRTKTDFLIMILIGVLVLIVMIPTGTKETSGKSKLTGNKSNEKNTQEYGQADGISDSEYVEQLEEQIRILIEQMDGCGKANVMITLSDDGQTYLDKNCKTDEKANTVIKVSDGKIAEVYKNDVRKSAFEIGW